MNVYSFSVSSHDFSYLILAVPFKAREDLSHLCHRWNDRNTPRITDSECAGTGIWEAHGLVPKVFVFQTMLPPKRMGSCSPFPASSMQRCSAPLACGLMFTHLLPPWAGSSLPSLEGVSETDSFLTSLSPTRAGTAPHATCSMRPQIAVKMHSAKGWLPEKACARDARPFFLVTASCGIILSMFGGASWAAFFWCVF